MVDRERQVFSVGRFLWRVIPLAIAAAVLWDLTQHWNASVTVWLVKALHRVAGRPSPYMYCDEHQLFWHATMFPPVVALTLGSYWLGWGGRLVRAVAGYVAHCGMTAVAITINESPYLQSKDMLLPLTSTLVNANYLMFGVVIWVLIAGPWYRAPERTERDGRRRAGLWRISWRAVRYGWLTRVALLWMGVALVVPVFGMFGSKEGLAARANVAKAMCEVPFFPQPSMANVDVDAAAQLERDKATRRALLAIEEALKVDADVTLGGPLFYLTSNLFLSMRPADPADVKLFQNRALLAYKAAMKYRSR